MGNENTVLTALGLDVSGFEAGTDSASGKVKTFLQGVAALDTELRKIPVLGDIYAITFGRIGEGFARTREEAREFARIMRTDVSGSLEGSIRQIDDINRAMGELKTGGFSRFLSDKITNAHRGLENVLSFGGLNRGSIEEERALNETKLNVRRAELQRDAVGLYEQEARARSEIYAQSTRESDEARIQIDFANRKVAAEEEATRLGGPERAKWSTLTQDNLKKEIALAEDLRTAEQHAADARQSELRINLNYATELSRLQVQGNDREIAAAGVRKALQQVNNAAYGTAEQKAQAAAALTIAKNAETAAKIQYEYAVRNAQIQTEVLELEVTGQTRAANQAKIRAQYETQIAEAAKSHNTELEKSLRAQQQSAQLAEKIREYNLGARGRAAERQQERHAAQVARIIQSRDRNTAINEAHNIAMHGHSSVKTKQVEVKLTGAEQFQANVEKYLGEMARELTGH